MKNWELAVKESRKNLWLVTTEKAKILCVKFKGRFFVKDCANMLPVVGAVIASEKL